VVLRAIVVVTQADTQVLEAVATQVAIQALEAVASQGRIAVVILVVAIKVAATRAGAILLHVAVDTQEAEELDRQLHLPADILEAQQEATTHLGISLAHMKV